MNRKNTAVFIGHKECFGITKACIKKEIIKLTEKGVTEFLNGGQGQFDRLCALCVYELKECYPQIKNEIVILYPNFRIFHQELFDEIIYPDDFEKYHYKSAIPARNQYMVKNAAYAICYITHQWGGASKTFQTALKNNVTVINLADTLA